MALISTFATDSPNGNRWHPLQIWNAIQQRLFNIEYFKQSRQFSNPLFSANKRSDKQLSKLVNICKDGKTLTVGKR